MRSESPSSARETVRRDHRDCTHKKEAWVTVALWDESLFLIVLVTVLCEQLESFFEATDSPALVVL